MMDTSEQKRSEELPEGRDVTLENAKNIEVDDLWRFVGPWGRYQVLQFVCLTLSALPLAFGIFTGVFTGSYTEPMCQVDNDTGLLDLTLQSDEFLEVGSCEVKKSKNASTNITIVVSRYSCSGYEYEVDKSHSYLTEWDLVCEKETLAQLPQMFTMLGMMVGASLLPQVGDRLGRKVMNASSHCLLMLVMVAMAYIPVFEVFLLLKVLSGALNQGLMISNFTMCMELFPAEFRTMIGFLMTAHWCISMSLLAPLAYFMRFTSWRNLQLLYGVCSISWLLVLCLADESLRWLLANKKVDRAKSVLTKMCKANKINYKELMSKMLTENLPLTEKPDFQDKVAKSNESPTKEPSDVKVITAKTDPVIWDILKSPVLRKMTLIICFCWMVNVMVYYGLTLLSTSLAGDPYINFILSGMVEFPSAIIMYYLLKICGRKITLMIFFITAAIFMMGAVIIDVLEVKSTALSILKTAFTLVGKLCISGSFNGIWVYTPELYPTTVRNAGIGIASAGARLAAVSTPLFTILARKVPWFPGTLFAVTCFLSAFLISFLPETVWRPLPVTVEEVEGWFHEGRDEAKRKNKQRLQQEIDYGSPSGNGSDEKSGIV